jgi:F-type H+-transporting ATPase subunit epsilon
MADTIHIEIVTPERKLVSDTATEVSIPGRSGYLGILPGHAPLISELAVGVISYHTPDGTSKHLACAWGFVEVLPDKVTILAEIAERAEDIDIDRAKAARERAEAAMKAASGSAEEQRKAHEDMLRATTRLEVAGKINPSLANLLP